jgi:tetratricopeptide (TPR) repeat protein
MKIRIFTLLIIAFFTSVSTGYTQPKLEDLNLFTFDKSYFDENVLGHWVVFPKSETDESYLLGFIYLNLKSGFTFYFHSKLKVEIDKLSAVDSEIKRGTQFTLDDKTFPLALLSDKQIASLKLPKQPNMQHFIEVSELVNKGFYFNQAGASESALKYLEKAYKVDPSFSSLDYELAYAYNHTGEYQKAIEVLDVSLKDNPNSISLLKELAFAYLQLKDIKKAEKIYTQLITQNKYENQFVADMALKMVSYYFEIKDDKEFVKWGKIVKENASPASDTFKTLNYYLENWGKKP